MISDVDGMIEERTPTPEEEAREMRESFPKELEALINRHCMENQSNTPDFILAQYLKACLDAFDQATQQRETWHGRGGRPLEPWRQ